jgi:hypothetical protein
MFLGQTLRMRLDCVRPRIKDFVEHKQDKQRENHGGQVKPQFFPDQKVLVRDYRGGKKGWVTGRIKTMLSPVTYEVFIDNGRDNVWKRHQDQLIIDRSESGTENVPFEVETDTPAQISPALPIVSPTHVIPVTPIVPTTPVNVRPGEVTTPVISPVTVTSVSLLSPPKPQISNVPSMPEVIAERK